MSSSTKNTNDGKKFLFDSNDFSDRKVPEGERPVYSENQVTVVKDQSYMQGRQDGQLESGKSREEMMLKCLERLETHTLALVAAEERREIEKMKDAAHLSLRVLQKILPQFAKRMPLSEIEHAVLAAIDLRREEPRLAITVPTAHLDDLKGRIDKLAQEKGYAGKIILLSDDKLPLTDCRIEWADGGLEYLFERLVNNIETEFAKSIAAMQAALGDTKK